MLDGAPSTETMTGFAPPRVETKAAQNYTPSPEFGKPTMTEPPKYSEPTDTANVDELMAQILGQKKNTEVISSPISKLPIITKTENKPQGLLAQIIEWFKTTFRNLFR